MSRLEDMSNAENTRTAKRQPFFRFYYSFVVKLNNYRFISYHGKRVDGVCDVSPRRFGFSGHSACHNLEPVHPEDKYSRQAAA